MKKIPSLFERDWNGNRSRVLNKVVEGCEWVQCGEGIATRKYDGTACRVLNGELWVRFDAKNGKKPPDEFEPAEEAPDPKTGHWVGWVRAGENPQYQWQRLAFLNSSPVEDGTYEACGPHFQTNPEGCKIDILIPHGRSHLAAPTDFDALREWFRDKDIEGIVWWHPDGRKAKIKKSDFGLPRKGEGRYE